MLYKNSCNRKSNQQSNLCTEILQLSDADEIAVCNLAPIAVNMFVVKSTTNDDGQQQRQQWSSFDSKLNDPI